MARQLSRQLTGRQIDGIWHTSVVVFGKEVFYGQGISTTLPGRSHHGAPLQVIDMGNTSIDEETFDEYLTEIRDHYTSDKYHLLDFNCNSFTNDCIGFLTGGSIPDFIKDLPADFLSTPFGAALRPTIDAMFRRPTSNEATPSIPSPAPVPSPTSDSQLAASILQAVAAQAQSSTPLATATVGTPLHAVTNPSSFHSFLRTHRAAVAFFTSATCPPCKMIEPVFEKLAKEKGVKFDGSGVGFAKIDIGAGLGSNVASEWSVRATPTFIFFLEGQKVDELKGADANELQTQIDFLAFRAYPPHPHSSISVPAVEALSLSPILFMQVPSFETVLSKLSSFIRAAEDWPKENNSKDQVERILSEIVGPYLKTRFSTPPPSKPIAASQSMLVSWSQATLMLSRGLPMPSLFPLIDLWRLAVLDSSIAGWLFTVSSSDPLSVMLAKATEALRSSESTPGLRNLILITLRLFSNAFATPTLLKKLFFPEMKSAITAMLINSLLHTDTAVRTAASSLAFNFSVTLQKGRIEKIRGNNYAEAVAEDEDWEVEVVSAVVEALDRETSSEEVVHRLTASLAFLIRLSPFYEAQICPLLESLQARSILQSKLGKGGKDGGTTKKEVKRLVEEVALKLCP